MSYNNIRECRGSALGEHYNAKWLINPYTNLRFNDRDTRHIYEVALTLNAKPAEQKIDLSDLKKEIKEFASVSPLFRQTGAMFSSQDYFCD